ncbi:5380_t:CDS:1, partial [Funneliformis mosseae]
FTYCLENSTLLYLEIEIKINIFKYVDTPLNLSLTCKAWNNIAKDPYAKA